MARFWKRDGQTGEAPVPEPVSKPLGYWEERLRAIGAQVDSMALIMNDLAISVAGGNVWIMALESNATRAQPGWDALSRRIEGVGAKQPARPPRAAERAVVLALIGSVLDRDLLTVREPCIFHQPPGYLVTALVETNDTWYPVNWILNEHGELA